MILRYEKFFENAESILKSRIGSLNQIKDVFLDVEDKFGISFMYNYYHFDKHNQIGSEKMGYTYYMYDESGSMIDKFYTRLYAPKGYFIVGNEKSFEVFSKMFGSEFSDLINLCKKRMENLIDLEIKFENDPFHINAIIQ